MEDEEKRIGKIIVASAILTSGVVFLVYAYRAKYLERAKAKIIEAIKSVNSKDYDEEDRNKVERLKRRYANAVAKARDKFDAIEVKEAFDEAVSEFTTSAKKLADSKIDALHEIYEHGLDKLDNNSEYFSELAAKYSDKIKSAVDIDKVRKLQKEFAAEVSRIVKQQA
jgi:hypothetical protein